MRRSLAVLVAVLITATACGQSGSPASPAGSAAAPTAAAAEKPVPGGRIVVGSISDVKTLQPVISADSASSDVWGYVYLGLLRTNQTTGDLEPGLAEKFEMSTDGLTVTYTLRDGLVWSDSTPFTADDYKYTAEAVARSKKTTRKSTFQDVVGWKDYVDGNADEVTGIQSSGGGKVITIKLAKALCAALRNLSAAGTGGIIPKASFVKVWNNKTKDVSTNIDDTPLNMNPPASIGPFVFKEFKAGVSATLVRNEKYFRGAPLIDELVVKVYADQAAVKAALLSGELSYGTVAPADVDEVQKTGGDKLTFYRNKGVASYNFISWNQKADKAPWLASKEVRQALWYGLNVKTIVDKVVLGYGHQVFAHTPQASWAYDDTGFTKYDYSVEKAKGLLEKAGAKMGTDGVYRWTDGKPMTMRIETNSGNNVRETVVQVAQEQYKAIGIKIDPLIESFPALLDRAVPEVTDTEGIVLGWSLGLDPDLYSIWHSSQQGKGQFNWIHYASPTVDKAIEDGRNGPDCSTAARKKAYAAVNKALNEDAPYTFLYTGDALVFASKQIQAFQPAVYSTASGWNIEKWWIKK